MNNNDSKVNIFYKIVILFSVLSILFIIYNKINYSDTNNNEKNIDLSSLLIKTESEKITGHKIQVEIQNGCGYKGIAKLYTNFLRNNGYDVIGYKNALNFNYEKTQLIIHKQDTSNFIDEIVNILQISLESIIYNYDDNTIYEMTVIVGHDYNILNSYDDVSMYYQPF